MKLSHNELKNATVIESERWASTSIEKQTNDVVHIIQGGRSIRKPFFGPCLQVILQLEIRREQTFNLFTVASPTKQQVNPLHYYSQSQHTAEKNHTPPQSAEKAPLKQKNREWNVDVCTSMTVSVCDRLSVLVGPVFLSLPKHVFDICMLEWLNLPLWVKFPKCHAMF